MGGDSVASEFGVTRRSFGPHVRSGGHWCCRHGFKSGGTEASGQEKRGVSSFVDVVRIPTE
jgi:hypothetical protein